MKKIKDFAEKERLEIPLLVKECRNGTTNKGAPYLSLILQDSSGTIDGKFWDVKPEDTEKIAVGRLAVFSFEVLLYNQNLQLRINRVRECGPDEVSLEEYVISSAVSEQTRKNELDRLVSSIKNPVYHKIVAAMLEKIGQKYMTYPAASRIHHSYLGGLSEHSLSMARLCETVCEHYPQLDRDLLISAALLHDTGKTAEMSGPVTTEYTLEGKLEGHISIANGWLSEVVEELGLGGCEEEILLHHMILSHHGHYEYGSPVLPMLQEAEVLCLIDNLDARMNTLKTALEATRPGGWTSKLFALDNRQFYRPKGNQ
ncbi:MAG: HD domain-containing protein [Erysipelotrichaceae bacterium]|nr:HD domain-containing protein [Erysipelotrichaceae bacterium]